LSFLYEKGSEKYAKETKGIFPLFVPKGQGEREDIKGHERSRFCPFEGKGAKFGLFVQRGRVVFKRFGYG